MFFFSGAAKKYFHGVAIIHTAIYCIRFTRLLFYAQQIDQIKTTLVSWASPYWHKAETRTNRISFPSSQEGILVLNGRQ